MVAQPTAIIYKVHRDFCWLLFSRLLWYPQGYVLYGLYFGVIGGCAISYLPLAGAPRDRRRAAAAGVVLVLLDPPHVGALRAVELVRHVDVVAVDVGRPACAAAVGVRCRENEVSVGVKSNKAMSEKRFISEKSDAAQMRSSSAARALRAVRSACVPAFVAIGLGPHRAGE